MINQMMRNTCTWLVVFLLSGCGLKIGTIDVGKTFTAATDIIGGKKYTEREKQQIGIDMTAIILGASTVHPSEELQAYVNRVGYWVALHSDAMKVNPEEKHWQFIVVDSKDFNAFAMPGGFVVISSGAISLLDSEAELAAILAHEIVHIEQDHHIKALEKSNRYRGISDLAFMASDTYAYNKGKPMTASSIQKRIIAAELVSFTHTLYTKGLSREDELDADQKAVILMARAGYDPYAYISLLQRLDGLDKERKLLMLSTHPEVADRLAVASDALDYLNATTIAATQTAELRFRETIGL